MFLRVAAAAASKRFTSFTVVPRAQALCPRLWSPGLELQAFPSRLQLGDKSADTLPAGFPLADKG